MRGGRFAAAAARAATGGGPGGPTQPAPLAVFDVAAKAAQKARAAAAADAADFDYLRDEVAARVVDRLCDMSRAFPRALDLYCGSGHVARALADAGNKPGLARLEVADVHARVVDGGARRSADALREKGVEVGGGFVWGEGDGEAGRAEAAVLEPASLDLVVSSCGLHWVNDLPGVMKRARALLKPDALFLAAMYGGETLRELRVSMQLAEDELRGGISPHVSPMVHPPDAGNLLQAAGLRLTTVDVDELVVPFRDMHALIRHLRGMGEGNAVASRRAHYGRRLFARAAEIYQEEFGYTDARGRPAVPATFQVVNLCGWSPDPSAQAQPRERGSATVSLGDLSQLAQDQPAEKAPPPQAGSSDPGRRG